MERKEKKSVCFCSNSAQQPTHPSSSKLCRIAMIYSVIKGAFSVAKNMGPKNNGSTLESKFKICLFAFVHPRQTFWTSSFPSIDLCSFLQVIPNPGPKDKQNKVLEEHDAIHDVEEDVKLRGCVRQATLEGQEGSVSAAYSKAIAKMRHMPM